MPEQLSQMSTPFKPIDLSEPSVAAWLGESVPELAREIGALRTIEDWSAPVDEVQMTLSTLCDEMNAFRATTETDPIEWSRASGGVGGIYSLRALMAWLDPARRFRLMAWVAQAGWGRRGVNLLAAPSGDEEDHTHRKVLESSLRRLFAAKLLKEIFSDEAVAEVKATLELISATQAASTAVASGLGKEGRNGVA